MGGPTIDQETVVARGRPLRVTVTGVAWPMETFVERLVVGLADRGVEVTVRSRLRPPSGWLTGHDIGWEYSGTTPARDLLWRQLQQQGPGAAVRAVRSAWRPPGPGSVSRPDRRDVIYAPWLNALMDDPKLFELGLPVVTSCRGALVTIAPWDPGRPGYRERLVEVFERATSVHCVSADIRGEAIALGLDGAKAPVIHPAVDPDVFGPPPEGRARRSGPCRVVSVGSLIWRKDGEHALRAVALAVEAGADLVYDVIGDGEDIAHLRFTIDDLGLGDRVRLLGRQSPEKIAALLHAADVFLHASCAEGVSNAVLEAMASGLPPVTTDAGGMSEAVRDDIDGYVVGVRDSRAMGDALVALAADPDRRLALGRSARQRVVDGFRLSDQIDAFVDLFDDVARRGGRP